MTQRDIRDYLQDILKAIELAQSFVANMSFDEFQADPKTSFASSKIVVLSDLRSPLLFSPKIRAF